VANSGEEWTVKRCKSLKVDFLRYLSGDACITPWLALNKSGLPRGILSAMFRYGKTDKKKRCVIINSLMVYSLFESKKVTDSQTKKFLEGLNAPNLPCSKEELDSFSTSVKNYFSYTRKIIRGGNHLLVYRGSPGKRSPVVHQNNTVPQDSCIDKELVLFNTPGGQYLYQKYQSLFDPVIDGTGHQRWMRTLTRPFPEDTKVIGGKISFIQEPGYKLRSVANPMRSYQLALLPFGKAIYREVKALPWDCTHDQQLAHPYIQNHLSQGETVHSVDLSSATDFFPLDLQLAALTAVFGKVQDIDLFAEISRSEWKSPLGPLSWKQGQPLGLYPSFGSFTMTHGLLLYWLSGSAYHHQFFVVGDDVVILDEDLFIKYSEWLTAHGCPYSAEKSISSNELSEFAGKIITSNAVYPQYKWRRMSDDNFLDLCRSLGNKSRSLLSSRQKLIFDKFKDLLPPVGLGFSHPGENYADMWLRTLDFMDMEKVARRSLMGLRSIVNTRLYTDFSTNSNDSYSHFDENVLKELLVTFDEKVRHVIKQTVFANYRNILSMIDAFECLPDQVGLDLPSKFSEPSRVTTLQRYEKLLPLLDKQG
jgi:hypothetical protein